MKKHLLIVLALILSCKNNKAFAEENVPESTTFTSQHWTTGLHLMAGLGVNTAYFSSDLVKREAGIGLNIHTSVGYFFFNDYAFEVGTSVMFNRVKRLLIWDTLGTMGIRMRLPTYLAPVNSHPYIKFAAGRGPTVFIAKGQTLGAIDQGGDRTQIEGDILSASYGIFQNARDGTTCFLDLTATVHSYRQLETIRDNKEVPEVISSRSIKDHAGMYALALTFGVIVF